jgi:hypothetical protein
MEGEPMAKSEILENAGRRRMGLRLALQGLEKALARAAVGRQDAWRERVLARLVEVREAFQQHVSLTEGPEGLFDDVLERAPRLDTAVRRLRAEHEALRSALEAALGRAGLRDGEDGQAVVELREAALSLISAFSRHRQRGADLVYEAYEFDIGTAD